MTRQNISGRQGKIIPFDPLSHDPFVDCSPTQPCPICESVRGFCRTLPSGTLAYCTWFADGLRLGVVFVREADQWWPAD